MWATLIHVRDYALRCVCICRVSVVAEFTDNAVYKDIFEKWIFGGLEQFNNSHADAQYD